jgi:hypothetical protein
MAAVTIGIDPLAYGSADKEGIIFRRYVKRRFLPWNKVEAIEWGPARLTVLLRDRTYLRPTLMFVLVPPIMNLIRQTFGSETPEIVQWLHRELEREGAKGLEVRRHSPRKSFIAQWREKRIDWWAATIAALCLVLVILVLAAAAQRL